MGMEAEISKGMDIRNRLETRLNATVQEKEHLQTQIDELESQLTELQKEVTVIDVHPEQIRKLFVLLP